MDLGQSNILITGAGRGIGYFLANSFLDKAAKVFVLDVQQQFLDDFPEHKNLVKYKCDITIPEEVDSIAEKIFNEQGGVHILINNAGIIHSEPLINLLSRPDRKHSRANWAKVINVNLNATFYVTSSVVERMVAKKYKGLIINISSIAAQGNVGQSAYAASKAAVEALTKTWSKELGMFKIRSACIAPGFFNTPSTKESLSEAVLSKWEKAVPVSRLGNLEELFSAVDFIIRNDYFNGKVLPLDGGLNI